MNRMDVMTKVSLMRAYESYWDMLPLELQEYIWKLKIAQMYIDAERKDMMNRLCREIETYALLKERWGLGHVKCVPDDDACSDCERYHLKVYGYYTECLVTIHNVHYHTHYRYLGFNVNHALMQVPYVKSLLQQRWM